MSGSKTGGFPSHKVKPELRGVAFGHIDPSEWVEPSRPVRSRNPLRPVRCLTESLLATYRRCNPTFSYKPKFTAPRRVLTNPSIPRHNDGADNDNYDLIMHVGDVLGSAVAGDQSPFCWKQNTRYTLIDMLGQGTFGQVIKCKDEEQGSIVAVKVLKNKPAYFRQGLLEIGILMTTNSNSDPTGEKRTVRFFDHFLYQNHLCLVFELLSMNLFELVKQNGFRGVSARLIRIFIRQMLDALEVMEEGTIVHCDMKPENVLLENLKDLNVKLIDFGSACFEKSTMYTYIQSRHYRCPEVLLGLQYSCAIDMWSLGCIAAELFLGIPIFPGANEYNQLYKITDMLGMPPSEMITKGIRATKFFRTDPITGAWMLKSEAEYERDQGVRLDPDKKYFRYRALDDLIDNLPFKSGYANSDDAQVRELRRSFKSFLKGVLQLDPTKRWTADQARQHPFITEQPLPENFQPPPPRRKPMPLMPSTTKTSSSSTKSISSDVCGVYHKFNTALRNGQVIDVATGGVLANLRTPINPAPYVEPAHDSPQMMDPRRFRSKSDAFATPPKDINAASKPPQLQLQNAITAAASSTMATTPAEPMSGVVMNKQPHQPQQNFGGIASTVVGATAQQAPPPPQQLHMMMPGNSITIPINSATTAANMAASAGRMGVGAATQQQMTRRPSIGKEKLKGTARRTTSKKGTLTEEMDTSSTAASWDPFFEENNAAAAAAATAATTTTAAMPIQQPPQQMQQQQMNGYGVPATVGSYSSGIYQNTRSGGNGGWPIPQQQQQQQQQQSQYMEDGAPKSWSQQQGLLIPNLGHNGPHITAAPPMPQQYQQHHHRQPSNDAAAVAPPPPPPPPPQYMQTAGYFTQPPIALGTSAPQGPPSGYMMAALGGGGGGIYNPPMTMGQYNPQSPPYRLQAQPTTATTTATNNNFGAGQMHGSTAPIPIGGPVHLSGGVGPNQNIRSQHL